MGSERKSLADLSAEELYALAREREQQELDRRIEAQKQERDALKKARRETLVRHRAELAELDRQILELGGRGPKTKAGRRRGGASTAGSISQRLCDIVATQPEMGVGDIRSQAEAAGIDTKNISQTLAYLKRQGRLVSPRRGVYSAA